MPNVLCCVVWVMGAVLRCCVVWVCTVMRCTAGMTELRHLCLTQTRVSGRFLSALASFAPHLQVLHLSQGKVRYAGLCSTRTQEVARLPIGYVCVVHVYLRVSLSVGCACVHTYVGVCVRVYVWCVCACVCVRTMRHLVHVCLLDPPAQRTVCATST